MHSPHFDDWYSYMSKSQYFPGFCSIPVPMVQKPKIVTALHTSAVGETRQEADEDLLSMCFSNYIAFQARSLCALRRVYRPSK